MAELVDALDSGSSRGNSVDVRVILAAKSISNTYTKSSRMMKDSIALVVNGEIKDYTLISEKIKRHKRLIAVDGGLNHCYFMHVLPQLLIGDLDSALPETIEYFSNIDIQQYPAEKDETDLELALNMLDLIQEKAIVYGALGGRIDHTLYNLSLLCRYPDRLSFETEKETIFALPQHKTISCYPGQTISLIPLGNSALNVTTRGLKWELHNRTLNQSFMSLSNICLGQSFEISFTDGQLLCCLQHSLNR